MGKKNDYLTLEESAQLLRKSTSWIKGIVSRGEIRAKLSGGQWLLALRDLDKLRVNLPPAPEKVSHNFFSDIPLKEPHRPPKTQLVTKERELSVTRPEPSKFPPQELELRKQVEEFNKKIRGLEEQIRAEQYERHKEAVRSKSQPAKAKLNELLSHRQQLKEQRNEAQLALAQEIQVRKERANKAYVKQVKKVNVKQVKVNVKQKKSNNAPKVNSREREHLLYQQVGAIQHEIKLEFGRYEEAKQKGRAFDVFGIRLLLAEQEALKGEYAKLGKPLGPLPTLTLVSKQAPQRKSKLPKRPSGQSPSPAKVRTIPQSPTVPTRYLSWRVLPPGELSVDSINKHYGRLQRQNPRIKYERERIVKAFSLGPKECYVGKNEFEGYVVFTFSYTSKALLECPLYGNAIYIIDSDWKRWSRMSKQELLSSSHEVTRIIHRGDWFSEVKRELKRR